MSSPTKSAYWEVCFMTKSSSIKRCNEVTFEFLMKLAVVSREVLHAGSGIRLALVKKRAAGKMAHNSIESGLRMAISSGRSGLHAKLTMDPSRKTCNNREPHEISSFKLPAAPETAVPPRSSSPESTSQRKSCCRSPSLSSTRFLRNQSLI